MQDGSATKRRRTGEGGGAAGAAADAPTAAAVAAAVAARDSSDSDSDSDSDSESAADGGLIAPRWLRGSGAGSSSTSDGGESSDSAGPAAGWQSLQDDVWAQLAQRRLESLAAPREDLGHVLLLKPEELGELLADAPASEKATAAAAEGVEGARLTWFSCGAPPPEEQEEEGEGEEGEGRMVAADNAATLPPGVAAPEAELVSALDGQPVAANTTANTTATVVTPAVAPPAAVSLCSRAALCALLRA
jgi:hypothetical protein